MNSNSPITKIKGIGEKTATLFHRVGVDTVGELLSYYPRTYDIYEKPVTFANLEMQYKSVRDAYVYFVFSGMEEGAVMENVAFNGKLILDFAGCDLLNNKDTNWKFGGFETDDAYTGSCIVDGEIQE